MFLRYNFNELRFYRGKSFHLRTYQKDDFFEVTISLPVWDMHDKRIRRQFKKSALGFGDKKRFNKLVNEMMAAHFMQKYTPILCKQLAVESQLLKELLC